MLCKSFHGCIRCSSFQQTCKVRRSEIRYCCTLQAPPIKKPSPPVSVNPSPVAAATASLQSVVAAAATPALSGAAAAADLEAQNATTRQPSPAAPKASPVPSEAVEVDYRWAPVIKHYGTVSATCTQLRCPSSPVHHVSPAGAVHTGLAV